MAFTAIMLMLIYTTINSFIYKSYIRRSRDQNAGSNIMRKLSNVGSQICCHEFWLEIGGKILSQNKTAK